MCVRVCVCACSWNIRSFSTSTVKVVTACFQVWHPKTMYSDPFHVLWVFQPWMSSPFLSLEACLLRTKSVYWDNPTPFQSLNSLCLCSKNRWWEGGRKKLNWKGDDWGIDWKGGWEGVVGAYLCCLQSSTWFIRKFQVKYFRNLLSSYLCFAPLEINWFYNFLCKEIGIK